MKSARTQITRQRIGLDVLCFYCNEYFPKEQATKSNEWKGEVFCPNCGIKCDYCGKLKEPHDVVDCDGDKGGMICFECCGTCNVCGGIYHEDELVTDENYEKMCDGCGTYCEVCGGFLPYDKLTEISHSKHGLCHLCEGLFGHRKREKEQSNGSERRHSIMNSRELFLKRYLEDDQFAEKKQQEWEQRRATREMEKSNEC